MAVFRIPVVPNVAHQEMELPVGERIYTLELRWSVREARWYLDVYGDDHEAIYTGIAVVLNFPLPARCVHEDFWDGVLYAIDTSTTNTEPALDDFGTRVILIYDDLAPDAES